MFSISLWLTPQLLESHWMPAEINKSERELPPQHTYVSEIYFRANSDTKETWRRIQQMTTDRLANWEADKTQYVCLNTCAVKNNPQFYFNCFYLSHLLSVRSSHINHPFAKAETEAQKYSASVLSVRRRTMKYSAVNTHRMFPATGLHGSNMDLGTPACIGYHQSDNRISSLGMWEESGTSFSGCCSVS